MLSVPRDMRNREKRGALMTSGAEAVSFEGVTPRQGDYSLQPGQGDEFFLTLIKLKLNL